MDAKQTRLGIILALAAYFIWGIAPAYFKLIYYVPADEILTHRVIWSFFFMVALIVVRLDQIDPHRAGEVFDLIGFQAR